MKKTAMEKNCIYCGTVFSTNRHLKKYCKDTCRQMAYLQRNGLVRVGISPSLPSELLSARLSQPELTLPEQIAVPVNKGTNERAVNDVKYGLRKPSETDEKQPPEKYTSESLVSDKTLEILTKKITEIFDLKLANALEQIRQENDKIRLASSFESTPLLGTVCKQEPFNGMFIDGEANLSLSKPCADCLNRFVKYGDNSPMIDFTVKERHPYFTLTHIQEPPLKETAPEISPKKAAIIPIGREEIENTVYTENPFREKIVNDVTGKGETQPEQKGQDDWEDEDDDEVQMWENEIIDRPDKLHCLDLAGEDDEPLPRRSIQDELYIKDLEEKLRRLEAEKQNIVSIEKIDVPAQKETEPEYHWIESKLIKNIEKIYGSNDIELRFQKPGKYWDNISIKCIGWANKRLRCLIENLVRLSNISYIDQYTFRFLAKGFIALAKSRVFANLPPNYPYAQIIELLAIKLDKMQKSNEAEKIKIQLPLRKKAELIAIRQQLLSSTAPMLFAELEFQEYKYLFVDDTKLFNYENRTLDKINGVTAEANKNTGMKRAS